MQSSIYDAVITNTVEDKDLTLYFVLDEAHRGMGTTSRDRSTIVQRLINGNGAVPPMPVVFGISATVERFESAMKDAKGRTALPSVEVDSAQVQASGLLKDDIVLSIPTEQGVFDTVLLRRAVEKVRASTAAWLAYADEQDEADPVVPLLVVQVGDKPTTETLVRDAGHDLRRLARTRPRRRGGLRGAPGPAGRPAGRALHRAAAAGRPARARCWPSLRSPRVKIAPSRGARLDAPGQGPHAHHPVARSHDPHPAGTAHPGQRVTQLGGLPAAVLRPQDRHRRGRDAHEGRNIQVFAPLATS